MPYFRARKICRGTITNLKVVLNTHKNPYLNLATQKTTCQNFPIQKLPKSNISNPRNPEYLLGGSRLTATPFSLTHSATSVLVISNILPAPVTINNITLLSISFSQISVKAKSIGKSCQTFYMRSHCI